MKFPGSLYGSNGVKSLGEHHCWKDAEEMGRISFDAISGLDRRAKLAGRPDRKISSEQS
jgi:hypothetical protein